MKKKQIVILAIILFQTTFLFSQENTKIEKNGKWTVGAILVNEWDWYNYLGGPHVSQNYFTGITVKRHFNSFTTRMGIEYINIMNRAGKRIDFGKNIDGYLNEGMIRLGIEKGYMIGKKSRPYFAIDLAALRSYYDWTYSGFGAIPSTNPREITRKTGLGFMPALGFEFKINKTISLSLETRCRFLFNKSNSKVYDYYSDSEHYENIKSKDFEITWNRIGGLALNFRF